MRRVSPPRREVAAQKVAPEQPSLQAAEHRDRATLSFGAVALAGLSLLGAACNQSTQPAVASEVWVEAPAQADVCLAKETTAVRVIVVDDFWNADKHTTHGEIVEAELKRFHQVEGENADVAVERRQVSLWGGEHGIKDGKPGALESYLQEHFAGRMSRDADALQSILEEGGPRGVIHQSQGASQSRAVDALYYRGLRDEAFGRQLQQQLGLEATPLETPEQKRALLQGLVQSADRIYGRDETVREARNRLRGIQDQLAERGYIHVISAGNQGYLSRDMQSLGVTAPADFFTNDFASPHSIIVGAADNGSKDVTGDRYSVASLASPAAGAHISADGVDRPMLVDGNSGHHSGSSYAAPQVSSTIVDLMRVDGEITRDEALAQLQQSATRVPGAESFLGSGVLGQPEMLLCHR